MQRFFRLIYKFGYYYSALRGNLPSPSKPLDHYKLGDLGLVPMGKACQSKSAGYVDSQRVKNNNGKV